MLELREPEVFITGFARANLRLEVQSPYSNDAKNDALLDFLEETPGAGIIYSSTRKRCEELVEMLRANIKRPVGLYHAGLLPDERREVQEAFMNDRLPIIVATNAFGMGIDKADLRFVVHYNIPGSLEAYYQEAGRAGRDGKPSRCLLLYSPSDRYVQEFFIENSYPSRDAVRKVYNYLRGCEEDPIEITLLELKERLDLEVGAEGIGACERLLEKCGAIERLDSKQNMAAVRIDSELPTLVDLLPREAKVRRRVLQCVEKLVGELRYERVYIQPRQIAAMTELKSDSVVRALKALSELRDFDYVPPFRGRAIHMLMRDVKFDKLEIDFEELDRRKQTEYDKLDEMVNYARTRRCRQREILDYFGDPTKGACRNCDNCKPDAGEPTSSKATAENSASPRHRPGGDERVMEAVRIALSGVARARGRFGKTVVAQMLCGSKSSKMTKWKLDRLSTFGLLGDLRQTEVDALIASGLIEQDDVDRYRPIVQLTEFGGEVMRDTQSLHGPPALPPVLRKRLELRPLSPAAKESPPSAAPAGKPAPVKPAPTKPTASTTAESTSLHVAPTPREGPAVGESRTFDPADFDPFAEANAEHVSNRHEPEYEPQERNGGRRESAHTASPPREPAQSGPQPEVVGTLVPASVENRGDAGAKAPTTQPEYYWTWRLLADGYSLEQTAAIRRLSAVQVLDHALRAADEGCEIDLAAAFTPAQLAALEKTIGHSRPKHLRPLLEHLPTGVTHQHVHLYLKCRAATNSPSP
jgi:ATP-dependent DNA helicase RecQ